MQNSKYKELYKEIEIIGKGSFGSATLIKKISTDQLYVAKKIELSNLSQKEQQKAKQEAEVLKQLEHPNIVAYEDSFIEKDTLIIIMEYCEEGDLSYHIKLQIVNRQNFPERDILNWFIQLSSALIYIHQKKILHRDIKTQNIFLAQNNTVKIGDFGISRVLQYTQEQAMSVVGTPYYMSPELCKNQPYSSKSDIWALGCVIYQLCALKLPFDANNLMGLMQKIIKDKFQEIPQLYSQDMQRLIEQILTKDEKLRSNLMDILNQQFCKQVMQEFVNLEGNAQTIVYKKTHTNEEIQRMLDKLDESKESSCQYAESNDFYLQNILEQSVEQSPINIQRQNKN
ncbi:protein kinase domain protein [Ichthyophthirius multifiliis]|uniref:non-specific serine/threonine protein kinase n=1 Tax=Ichthyophthirius multifiliis TaxID=5932 RepID=G0R064_ICHMU|nr:protein kinase domain protein [Ichthyophthirius multifiliis]EGR29124.1 protein kinase domain protein [Ichthyophthirius multifiliis]|eukprot:XP_004030360.1 protein kinase domain protein [Ichthyophthirius multifiliis]